MKIPPAMQLAIDALATEGIDTFDLMNLRPNGIHPPTTERRAVVIPWDADKREWNYKHRAEISDASWYLLRDVFLAYPQLADEYGNEWCFYACDWLGRKRKLTREEVMGCCTGPTEPRDFDNVIPITDAKKNAG
jgi:hypothetical protein